jgi:hypothetical protein
LIATPFGCRKFAPFPITVGLIPVNVAAGGASTLKVTGALLPPPVVTVTLRATPAAEAVAPEAIWKVAVICVAETTVTLVTWIPSTHGETAHVTCTVAPARKLVPVRVTGTLAPTVPLVGVMVVNVGAGGTNSTAPIVVALFERGWPKKSAVGTPLLPAPVPAPIAAEPAGTV